MYLRHATLSRLFPRNSTLLSGPLPQVLHFESKINRKDHVLQTVAFYKKFHASSYVYKLFGTFNPLKVLDTWLELEKLKHEWDPNFGLSNFKFGAKQALCMVVNLIQENSWNELKGLICSPLVDKLQSDHEMLKKVKETEALTPENILAADVSRVVLQEIVDNKYCDIEITFRLRKDGEKCVAFQYILRFHREYTKGKLPQWTIVKIQVEKYEM